MTNAMLYARRSLRIANSRLVAPGQAGVLVRFVVDDGWFHLGHRPSRRFDQIGSSGPGIENDFRVDGSYQRSLLVAHYAFGLPRVGEAAAFAEQAGDLDESRPTVLHIGGDKESAFGPQAEDPGPGLCQGGGDANQVVVALKQNLAQSEGADAAGVEIGNYGQAVGEHCRVPGVPPAVAKSVVLLGVGDEQITRLVREPEPGRPDGIHRPALIVDEDPMIERPAGTVVIRRADTAQAKRIDAIESGVLEVVQAGNVPKGSGGSVGIDGRIDARVGLPQPEVGLGQRSEDLGAPGSKRGIAIEGFGETSELGEDRPDAVERVGRIPDHPPRFEGVGGVEVVLPVGLFFQQTGEEFTHTTDDGIGFVAKEILVTAVAVVRQVVLADLESRSEEEPDIGVVQLELAVAGSLGVPTELVPAGGAATVILQDEILGVAPGQDGFGDPQAGDAPHRCGLRAEVREHARVMVGQPLGHFESIGGVERHVGEANFLNPFGQSPGSLVAAHQAGAAVPLGRVRTTVDAAERVEVHVIGGRQPLGLLVGRLQPEE